jgi:formylglycine-generating enzyme required for sulfatase activity
MSTGDRARSVQAETYVEQQTVSGEVPIDPDELRRCYLNHLYERVRRIALSGIDPDAVSTEARLNLGAVYTALRTLTRKERDHLARENCLPEQMARGEQRRLSAVTQLDRHRRLVLLGEPGSGKSTFVNFVTLCLAGERLGREPNLARLREPLPAEDEDEEEKEGEEQELQPWSHGALLPVRVVLRDFAARGLPPVGERATAKHLRDFIAAELDEAALEAYEPHLAQHLQQQGGLILLDGLDEVPKAHQRREQIKQAVEDFAAVFRKCRFLVTSRTYAYQQQAWRMESFEETVLAPFDQGQIRRFVERWYAHIAQLRDFDNEEAQGRAALLQRAISNSERLQALAERPLLLTLMASLHAWRGGSLPEKRESLYADTVDLLLDWWERPKAVRDGEGNYVVRQPSLAEWLRVDREKVRDLLERLAYEAHAGQPELVGTADVPEGELLSGLLRLSQNPDASTNPAQLVHYLSQRAGLLVPRGVGVYTFPHRTFQEYLAACHLTDYEYPDRVAELARDDPNRWREVALLAGAKAARGTASAVWSLVDALCYRDLSEDEAQSEDEAWGALLAGQALAESADLDKVSERNRVKVERVQAHLVHVMEDGQLPAVERAAAGRALAKLGDPRRGVGLCDDGLPDIAWCEVPAGSFVMGTQKEDIPSLLKELGGERAWYEWEVPQHEQEIEVPYRISRYPITNAQFAAFVKTGGYREERYWTQAARKKVWCDGKVKGWGDDEPREGPYDFGDPFNLPNHPVVGVTWYEAVAFCLWLTEELRERGKLEDGQEISLPTEPQWEKAARSTDGRLYLWGEGPDPNRANYEDTGIGTTSAVGCFPGGISPYGIEDLSGNVWEWCRTKWESDYEGYQNDSALEGFSLRVLRGGSFYLAADSVRCAARANWDPYNRDRGDGFRVVVAPFSQSVDL